MLQWGRRNYPAETSGLRKPAMNRFVSFNGAAGITRRKRLRSRINKLQSRSSFNGAAGITRRKRAPTPRTPGEATDSFNGAAGITRRKRSPLSIRQSESNRFNGAAGITRRKPEVVMVVANRDSIASMGPPELPGGNLDRRIPDRAGSVRFNGAAGITRRKPLAYSYGSGVTSVLQWGRRNYPAETLKPEQHRSSRLLRFNGAAGITRRKRTAQADATSSAASASMGPPELPGGNMNRAYLVLAMTDRLQWGRRNYPAETADGPCSHDCRSGCFNGAAGITRRKLSRYDSMEQEVVGASMGPPELPGGNPVDPHLGAMLGLMLQWGRRNYPAETARNRDRVVAENDASMGPPELPGGNRCLPMRTLVFSCCGFNGAAGITRRKLDPFGAIKYIGTMLQWGRRNYPAET